MLNIVKSNVSAACGVGSVLCRVVQKNLVFVVGLSPRLCDAEILRRHEYFGKFGKIHKVVINQSTSYVGSQVRNIATSVFFVLLAFSALIPLVGNYEGHPPKNPLRQYSENYGKPNLTCGDQQNEYQEQ